MAFNGSGVFNRLFTWATDKTNNVPVTASRMDSEMDGMATGLSNCIVKDGQQTTTARIPFALGVSSAAGSTSSVSYAAANDGNTGVYFPAADQVALAAGGVQALLATATALTPGSLIWGGMGATPIGGIMDYAGTSAPTGWLLCFGQSLDRTTYADLFTAIGTTYGTVDGTHFTLPDCRGRAIAGKDDMGGSSANRLTNQTGGLNGDTLGGTGGTETHALLLAQNASHTHTATSDGANVDHTHVAPDHTHAGGDLFDAVTTSTFGPAAGATAFVTAVNNSGGGNTAGSNTATMTTSGASADHTHTLTTASSGSGTAHNNVQPTIILNKIIFAGV